jgi:hypothetical protein
VGLTLQGKMTGGATLRQVLREVVQEARQWFSGSRT